jgi:hypothetical protein
VEHLSPCGIDGHGRHFKELWHRLLGGQRLSMGDYVTGPGATRGAGGAGGR